MKKRLLTSVLFALALQQSAGFAADNRPLMTSVWTETPPVLDGQLDDAVWQKAKEAANFTQITPEHLPAKSPTYMRCLYDAHNLYISFRCVQPAATLKAQATADGAVWFDDCVDFFITPHISTTLLQTRFPDEQHFHFIMNSAGTKFDELGTGGANSWDGVWETKTSVSEQEWRAEIKIPFSTLYEVDRTPPPFTSWKVQFGRSTVASPENTSLFPTTGVFRNPAGFGYLVFVTKAQDDASIRWNIDRQNTMTPRLRTLSATLQKMAPLRAKFGTLIDAQEKAVSGLTTSFEKLSPNTYTTSIQADFLDELAKREAAVRDLQEKMVLEAAGKSVGSIILSPHAAVKDSTLVKPDFLPVLDTIGKPVTTTVAPEQYQAASFVMWNKSAARNVTVKVSPLKAKGVKQELAPSTVDVRWVRCWYQAGHNDIVSESKVLTPELLVKNPDMVNVDLEAKKNITLMEPGMGERGYPGDATELQPLKTVPARTANQVWLTVQVPKGTAPGLYTGEISVWNDGRKASTLPIEINVLDFELAPSMLEHNWYAKTLWGLSEWGQTPERSVAEVQNMVRHGVDTVSLMERLANLPKAIAIMQQGGMKTERLYVGGDGGNSYFWSGMTPQAAEKQAADWVTASKAQGVKELYLYLEDEAKGEKLRLERPIAEAMHKTGAKTWVACYPDFFPIAGDFINAPNLSGALVNQTLVKQIHDLGHKVFSYGNPQGGVEKPERYRRNYGLLLWQNNYDGCFNFALYWSFGTGKGNWCPWDDFQHPYWRQHCMVYPTKTGLVDTIQWEGWREGVTDCRYLATLLREIEKAKQQNRTNPAVQEAATWVANLKSGKALALADLDAVRASMINHIQACRAAGR